MQLFRCLHSVIEWRRVVGFKDLSHTIFIRFTACVIAIQSKIVFYYHYCRLLKSSHVVKSVIECAQICYSHLNEYLREAQWAGLGEGGLFTPSLFVRNPVFI